MSTSELLVRLAAGLFLTLGNAFFVVTEFALTRVRQFEEEDFQEHPGLRRAWEMTKQLEIYLTGCQLGITTTSILLGIVAEPAVTELLRPLFGTFLSGGALSVTSVVVSVVIINLIHKIWGEQAPTYLGVERPREVARYGAPVLYWWVKITYPFILLGDGLAKWSLKLFGVEMTRSWTEAEEEAEERRGPVTERLTSLSDVRHEMGRVLSRGDLSHERREEVMRALDIEQMPVREIMVPREEAVALHADASLEESLNVMRADPHDRYPLIGDNWEDIRGTVYTMEVFQQMEMLTEGAKQLEEVARSPMTVPADLAVSALIDHFQDENQELAFVLDAEQHVLGLVTTTDAFEAIAGELEDPMDV